MAIEFSCAHCQQRLSSEEAAAGQPVHCPACGQSLTVPAHPMPAAPQPSVSDIIYCPACGQQNLENTYKCTRCATVLHRPAAAPSHVVSDGTMGGLIPYKNARALTAYYLGIFSLIPCVGIPLGIAALILGIGGLKFAQAHPEARGKAHAWTGIILGGLCALVYTLLILIPLLGTVLSG